MSTASTKTGRLLLTSERLPCEYNYYYQYYYHKDGYRPLTPASAEDEEPPSDPSRPAAPPN
jgi:hypothetical protein